MLRMHPRNFFPSYVSMSFAISNLQAEAMMWPSHEYDQSKTGCKMKITEIIQLCRYADTVSLNNQRKQLNSPHAFNYANQFHLLGFPRSHDSKL